MEITTDIANVFVHPLNLMVRGHNPPLTGLKDSVAQDGQAYALGAVVMPDGTYGVYEGGRRLAAMTAAGFLEVRLSVEQLTEPQILDRIAASDIKEPLPHIVMRNEEVVGGKVWLVSKMLDGGANKRQIAVSWNTTIDIISAYQTLLSEEVSVQNAVASGRLDITAYSRVKNKTAEFKRQLVEPAAAGKKVSVRDVLRAIEVDDPVAARRKEMVADTKAGVPLTQMDILFRVRADLRSLASAKLIIKEGNNEVWDDITDLVGHIGGRGG